MIKDVTVDFILELSQQGLSQRKIAKEVGVARETVRRVLSGRRKRRNHIEGVNLPSHTGTPQRCQQCGGLVYMPCLACTIRNLYESMTQ